MRRRQMPRALLAATTFLAAASQAPAKEPILKTTALQQAGYGKFWESTFLTGGNPVLSAHLLDENLYLTTDAGLVCAVQADTGLLRWMQDLGDRSVRGRAPAHVQSAKDMGPVLFVTYSKVAEADRSL